MNLFLDDIRKPEDVFFYTKNTIYLKEDWIILKNHDEFIKFVIKNGMPKLISFDHDLGDEHYIKPPPYKEKTGFETLKWVCNYAINNNVKLSKMLFHSANVIGRKNMITYYINFKKYYPHLYN